MQRSPFITPPLQGSLTSFIDYGGDDNFGSGGEGGILFYSNSSADHAVIVSEAAPGVYSLGGLTEFNDQSTAGNSQITVRGGGFSPQFGSYIYFLDSSAAGNAVITIDSAEVPLSSFASPVFDDSASAGNATFSFKAAFAEGVYAAEGSFHNTTTADHGTFFVNGATVAHGQGCQIFFYDSSTAAESTFTLNGGEGEEAGPGSIQFLGNSSAGNATITINGGTNGGQGGNCFVGEKSYSGGTARFEIFGNGLLYGGGASFSLITLKRGSLTVGTVFTIISNTSATPVVGTFDNLPDGTVITAGGNNLQASYEGGDGNDLTLTAVP